MKKQTEKFDAMGFYLNNETPKQILMTEVNKLSYLCLKLNDKDKIQATIDLLITINSDLKNIL